MTLENRIKLHCQSKRCNGEERNYIKIGSFSQDKNLHIYVCEKCDQKVYRRGKWKNNVKQGVLEIIIKERDVKKGKV